MKRYLSVIILIAVCALVCPMQSCANRGGTKTEASALESALSVESAEPDESVKKPAYQMVIESLLRVAAKQDSDTNFPLFFAH